MSSILQSQVFFFVSSVGFILLWIMIAIFLFYLIRVTKTLSRIMEKVEKDVNNIGDTTKELLEDLRDNVVFNFLFGKKKRRPKERK